MPTLRGADLRVTLLLAAVLGVAVFAAGALLTTRLFIVFRPNAFGISLPYGRAPAYWPKS